MSISYTCPICQQALNTREKSWFCINQHSFDVARQGYVNLLPVQYKKSKLPGDAKEMVAARRNFLDQGFYHQLAKMLLMIIKSQEPERLLDIGCGDGYFTQTLVQGVDSACAIDVSKPAVISCAKRLRRAGHAHVQCLVASAGNLPLADGSVDAITSIFAPILPAHFARVLDGGMLIIAKPDTQHLSALRKALFDQVNDHASDKFLDQLRHDFKLVKTERLKTMMTLNGDQINQLMTMTPYAYRAKPCRRDVAARSQLTDHAMFVIYYLRKR